MSTVNDSQPLSDEELSELFVDLGEKDQRVIIFLYEWDRPIRAGDLRRHLEIPHSTLNSVLKRLEKKKFVHWKGYGTVSAFDFGKKIAAHHLQHHIIIHHYFEQALGLSSDDAHSEGLKVAGVLSCNTVKTMKSLIPGCQLGPCKIEFNESLIL